MILRIAITRPKVDTDIEISFKEYHPIFEPQNDSGYASFNRDFLFAIMQNISCFFLFKHISLFHNVSYNCIHFFFMGCAKKSKHNKDV